MLASLRIQLRQLKQKRHCALHSAVLDQALTWDGLSSWFEARLSSDSSGVALHPMVAQSKLNRSWINLVHRIQFAKFL